MKDRLPKVYDSGQLSLFPTAPKELCEALGLPWWAAVQLYKEELISFDPEKTADLSEPQMAELTFVGSMVAADCSPRTLLELLSGLTKPYCYSHRVIYYHWPSRKWKRIPEPDDEADEYRPSPIWRLIPSFPRHPAALNLFTGLSRQPEEYAAAFHWLDSLAEEEDVQTLQEVRSRIDQLLSDMEDDQEPREE